MDKLEAALIFSASEKVIDSEIAKAEDANDIKRVEDVKKTKEAINIAIACLLKDYFMEGDQNDTIN